LWEPSKVLVIGKKWTTVCVEHSLKFTYTCSAVLLWIEVAVVKNTRYLTTIVSNVTIRLLNYATRHQIKTSITTPDPSMPPSSLNNTKEHSITHPLVGAQNHWHRSPTPLQGVGVR